MTATQWILLKSDTTVDQLTALTGQSVTVLVPGEQVRMRLLQMPKQVQRKAREAVGYLLEDELCDSVEDNHFALAQAKDNVVPVAIVAKRLMMQWQAMLQSAAIEVESVLPDYLALPWQPNTWTIFVTADKVWLRQDEYVGFVIRPLQLAVFLGQAFLQATGPLPEVIRVYTTQDAAPIALEAIDSKCGAQNIACEYIERAQDKDALFAQGVVSRPPVQLLQGAFLGTPKKSAARRWWQISLALLAASVLVLLLGKGLSLWVLSSQTASVNEAIKTEYARLFPGETAGSDIQLRVQKVLDQGGTGLSDPTAFFPLFLRVSPLLADSPMVELKSLQYEEAALMLDLSLPSFNDLEHLTAKLKSAGLSVNTGEANRAGDTIDARLTIHG